MKKRVLKSCTTESEKMVSATRRFIEDEDGGSFTLFVVLGLIVMFATAGYLGMNLLVDILYGVLDPRIRQS